jgi:NitT/TauT family transport system substrate-binding protein
MAALAISALTCLLAFGPVVGQSPEAEGSPGTGGAPAASLPIPTIPETPTTMEFLYSPFTDYAPFFIAEDKGYFDAYGVDATLADKSGTSETIQLLATGQSQSGGSTWGSSFFNSIDLGATVAVVAQLARINPDPEAKSPVPLIVSKPRFDSGEITQVADLEGKRVGIPGPGGFGEYSVYLALTQGGLTMDQVELVNVPPPAAAEGLANNSFEASWTIEPFATGWMNDGLVASISDDHALGVELGFLAFNNEWLEANTDAAIRFTAAYMKAARELDGGGWSDPEIQEIVARWTNLETDFLTQIGLTVRSEDLSLDEASIRDQEAYFRSAGQLEYEGEADLDSVYRRDVLAAASAFLDANP